MAASILFALDAAQIAAAPPPSLAPGIAAIDFDLARAASAAGDARCRGAEADAILVCGRRAPGPDYPLAEMERLFMPRAIRAETGLPGGGTGALGLQQMELDRGAVSRRVMIHLRWPL